MPFLTRLLLAASLMTLAACNTMEGLGKDIQSGGEALEDAAESTKRAINE